STRRRSGKSYEICPFSRRPGGRRRRRRQSPQLPHSGKPARIADNSRLTPFPALANDVRLCYEDGSNLPGGFPVQVVEACGPNHRVPGNAAAKPTPSFVPHPRLPSREVSLCWPGSDSRKGEPGIPPRPSDRHAPPHDRGQRINEQIRISPVRLIGVNGEQLGVVPTSQALDMAREAQLDLVEVAPMERPP